MLGGDETVLVVEDEQMVRTAACRMLRDQGYTVLEAGDAAEALMLCEQNGHRVDLLLTDVVMPRMSGRELTERLHASRPGLRCVYMSGYTDDAIIRHGVLEDDAAFVQKPFSKRTLLEAVRNVLDASPPG